MCPSAPCFSGGTRNEREITEAPATAPVPGHAAQLHVPGGRAGQAGVLFTEPGHQKGQAFFFFFSQMQRSVPHLLNPSAVRPLF